MQFSIACGASRKWIQNTARILGLRLAFTTDEARHLGLVRQLQADLGLPLAASEALAAEALETATFAPAGSVSVGGGTTARIAVDVACYLSDFSVRLARAAAHEPRRRGRPRGRGDSAVALAEAYGLDIGLLRSSLRRSPAERIMILDENQSFARTLRGRR